MGILVTAQRFVQVNPACIHIHSMTGKVENKTKKPYVTYRCSSYNPGKNSVGTITKTQHKIPPRLNAWNVVMLYCEWSLNYLGGYQHLNLGEGVGGGGGGEATSKNSQWQHD